MNLAQQEIYYYFSLSYWVVVFFFSLTFYRFLNLLDRKWYFFLSLIERLMWPYHVWKRSGRPLARSLHEFTSMNVMKDKLARMAYAYSKGSLINAPDIKTTDEKYTVFWDARLNIKDSFSLDHFLVSWLLGGQLEEFPFVTERVERMALSYVQRSRCSSLAYCKCLYFVLPRIPIINVCT